MVNMREGRGLINGFVVRVTIKIGKTGVDQKLRLGILRRFEKRGCAVDQCFQVMASAQKGHFIGCLWGKVYGHVGFRHLHHAFDFAGMIRFRVDRDATVRSDNFRTLTIGGHAGHMMPSSNQGAGDRSPDWTCARTDKYT